MKKLLKLLYQLIYKLFYPRIIYLDHISNDKPYNGLFIGLPLVPVILIENDCKNEKDLLIHELTHYKQWLRTFMLWELFYLFKYFKYKWELEAYAYQLKYIKDNHYSLYHDALLNITNFLLKYYNLKKSRTKIMNDLENYINKIDKINT